MGKSIEELKNENIPSAKLEDMFSVGESEYSEEVNRSIQKYLDGFVNIKDGKCICCGTTQGGLLGSFFGGFRYGIVHGEGECSTCGYPARTKHVFIDDEGKELCTLSNYIMQYHPSVLESN